MMSYGKAHNLIFFCFGIANRKLVSRPGIIVGMEEGEKNKR